MYLVVPIDEYSSAHQESLSTLGSPSLTEVWAQARLFFLLKKHDSAIRVLAERCAGTFLGRPLVRKLTRVRPPGLFPYGNGTPFASYSPRVHGSARYAQGLLVLLEAIASRGQPKYRFAQFCPPTRTRTWDQPLKRRMLYQLSYGRIYLANNVYGSRFLPYFATKNQCRGCFRVS